MRDKYRSVVVTTTDLSAAFNTCDFFIILNMLKHLGVRDKELQLMTTYLIGRHANVKIQGFTSELKPQPDCSVIQSLKLSSSLYTVYTLDTMEVKDILKEPEAYKSIVGKDITPIYNPDHECFAHFDDMSHVTGLNKNEEQEIYINNMYSLLEPIYSNKNLKINGTKTQFLTIANARYENQKIKLQIDDNNTVTENKSIKLLGFMQNRRNMMDSRLNNLSAKAGMILSKMRSTFAFIPEEKREQIITAKVKSITL